MNKQRSQSRQECQLQGLSRPMQTVSPFHRSEQQKGAPIGQPQYPTQQYLPANSYHTTAPKGMPTGKVTDLPNSKENVLVGPYGLANPLTPKGSQQRLIDRHCKSPLPLKPQASSCENTPLTIHSKRVSQMPGRMPRDRALTDLSTNLFNSGVPLPAMSRTQELMKHKWVHITPEAEATKFNSVHPPVSASFNIESFQLDQNRLVVPNHRRENSDGARLMNQANESQKRCKETDRLAERIRSVEKGVDKLPIKQYYYPQQPTQEQCNLLFTKQLQTLASLKKSQSRNSIDSDRLSQQTLQTQCSLSGSNAAFSLKKPRTTEIGDSTRKTPIPKRASHEIFPAGGVLPQPHPASVASPRAQVREGSLEQPTYPTFNFLKKKQSMKEESTASKPLAAKPAGVNMNTPIKQPAPAMPGQPVTSSFQQPQPGFDRPPVKLEDFEVGKQLGKGKFGQVFLVKYRVFQLRHKLTGFICAMKVISKQSIREDKLENQMTRELMILSFVKHPNLISCYGFFADAQSIYVLMELCSGGHLYKQIQDKRRLPEAEAAILIKQVCEGVKYLHSLQILHRDIKPENIILENGIAKICDFGWSVFSYGLRKTVCGTPLYLSPEVVKGEDYDEKIDLWAIGILTYELIIGRIPFKIWSQAQLNRIVSDEVTFPDYVEVSDKAKDFILKILQKEPSKRRSLDQLLGHPFLTGIELVGENTLLQ